MVIFLCFSMSVEEHLWFYGRLKGLGKEKLQGEIDQMVKDVGLPHKRKELSRNLSGNSSCIVLKAVILVTQSK